MGLRIFSSKVALKSASEDSGAAVVECGPDFYLDRVLVPLQRGVPLGSESDAALLSPSFSTSTPQIKSAGSCWLSLYEWKRNLIRTLVVLAVGLVAYLVPSFSDRADRRIWQQHPGLHSPHRLLLALASPEGLLGSSRAARLVGAGCFAARVCVWVGISVHEHFIFCGGHSRRTLLGIAIIQILQYNGSKGLIRTIQRSCGILVPYAWTRAEMLHH
eukprot:g48368.t1